MGENPFMKKVFSVNVSIDLINQCEEGLVDMKASKEKALMEAGILV